MTKAEMIKTLQLKEAKLFLKLKEAELLFDKDSYYFKSLRTEFCIVSNILDELGIKVDFSLPDNQKVTNIIMGKYVIEE